MHILHITINPIRMERRILNQVDYAHQQKHTLSVIYLEDCGENQKKTTLNFQHLPIQSPFAKGGPFKFIHFNWRVFNIIISKEIDLIHAHDLWVLPAAALVSSIKKIPLIYDAHEYYAGLEIFTRRKFRKAVWLQAEKWCLPQVRALITISEPLAELYRKKYKLACPVAVIRNLPAYERPDPAKAQNIFSGKRHKTLLYHGHFRPGRGLMSIIHACAMVKNVHLVLIGGGELEEPLRKIVSENRMQAVVDFIPYIETERLISTAAQADIGVVLFEPTSLNYAHALPNKFFEYLMAGIPVLASNIDTFEYYVKKYQVGLTVNPLDINEVAGGINKILSDEKQLVQWRKNALNAARELNWQNESGKLMPLYSQITG